MAATTTNQDAGTFSDGYDVELDKLAPSADVPADTLAVNDGGEVKRFTSALYVAGKPLLGRAHQHYANPSSTDTKMGRFTFRRGCPMRIATKSGDAPTRSYVGGYVYVSDNFEIQKTAITDGLKVFLIQLSADESYGTIQLP